MAAVVAGAIGAVVGAFLARRELGGASRLLLQPFQRSQHRGTGRQAGPGAEALLRATSRLESLLRELQELDEARASRGALRAVGVAEANRALEVFLASERSSPGQGSRGGATSTWESTRVARGGRTYETGLQHLASLRELRPYKVLLLGDSHVERFPRMVHGGAHFPLVEDVAGRAFAAGVGGDGVAELAWRLREQRLLDQFTAPLSAVIVQIGSNDVLKGCNPEAAAEEAAELVLSDIVGHPMAATAAVGVLAVPPVQRRSGSAGIEKILADRARYNEHLQGLLGPPHTGDVEFLDLFRDIDEAVAEEELFAKDGVHLSPQGYMHLAAGLRAWLLKSVKQGVQ